MKHIYVYKLRPTEILLLLYVVFIPLESVIVIEGLGTLTRIIGYCLLLVFLLEYKIKWNIVSKEAYVFTSYLVLSMLWAREWYLEQGLRIIFFFLLILIIVNLLKKNDRLLNSLVLLFCASTFIVAITSFVGFLYVEGRYGSLDEMGLAPLSLLFSVAYAFQLSRLEIKRASVFNYILLIGNLLGAIATGTRASWLAILIVTTIFNGWRLNVSVFVKRVFISVVVVVVIMMSVPAIQFFMDSRIEALTRDQGARRTIIWKVALEMWKDKPLLGFGYRNFPTNFTHEYIVKADLSPYEYNRLKFSGNRGENRGSHSDYISIAVELGLLGLMLYLLWIKRLLRNLKTFSPYYFGFFLLLIMSFFQDNINQKIFWTLFGIMEFLKSSDEQNLIIE